MSHNGRRFSQFIQNWSGRLNGESCRLTSGRGPINLLLFVFIQTVMVIPPRFISFPVLSFRRFKGKCRTGFNFTGSG